MRRREILKLGAGMGAVPALAAPALAQSMPEIRWRLQCVVPKSFDVIYGAAEQFAKSVLDTTDGKFRIQVFPAGDIVSPFATFDATASGTIESTMTGLQYFYGKSPAFAIMAHLPFGLNTRQSNAWLFAANGNELINSILAKSNLYALPAGGTGEQMGGWFRKEVRTVDDIKGLKFRTPGFAGEIFSKLGATPQQIPAGEVYSALERGTIDAAEFLGPHDDEKMGLVRVAPYYYYPSFWEPNCTAHFAFNLEKWNELPALYKACVKTAAADAHYQMTARYDMLNPPALKRLIAAGAQMRSFPQEVFDAAHRAALDLYKSLSESNADFKAIYDSQMAVRDDLTLWTQLSETSYSVMLSRSRGKR